MYATVSTTPPPDTSSKQLVFQLKLSSPVANFLQECSQIFGPSQPSIFRLVSFEKQSADCVLMKVDISSFGEELLVQQVLATLIALQNKEYALEMPPPDD